VYDLLMRTVAFASIVLTLTSPVICQGAEPAPFLSLSVSASGVLIGVSATSSGGLADIDVTTFQFVFAGADVTSLLLSALGTPAAMLTVSGPHAVIHVFVPGLAQYAMSVQLCNAVVHGGLCGNATHQAGSVAIKDHLTDATLYNYPGGSAINQMDDSFGGPGGDQMVGLCAFTGTGQTLQTVGGVFLKAGFNNVPNGGDWSQLVFRVVYYVDTAAILTNSAVGSAVVQFSQPSNAGWNQRVGSWMGYDLFYFEFDVASMNLVPSAGAVHYVAIIPYGLPSHAGWPGMMLSQGGPTAVGAEIDWLHDDPHNLGPGPLPSYLNWNWAAYRVTVQ
jgi:hypothetical protein